MNGIGTETRSENSYGRQVKILHNGETDATTPYVVKKPYFRYVKLYQQEDNGGT